MLFSYIWWRFCTAARWCWLSKHTQTMTLSCSTEPVAIVFSVSTKNSSRISCRKKKSEPLERTASKQFEGETCWFRDKTRCQNITSRWLITFVVLTSGHMLLMQEITTNLSFACGEYLKTLKSRWSPLICSNRLASQKNNFITTTNVSLLSFICKLNTSAIYLRGWKWLRTISLLMETGLSSAEIYSRFRHKSGDVLTLLNVTAWNEDIAMLSISYQLTQSRSVGR